MPTQRLPERLVVHVLAYISPLLFAVMCGLGLISSSATAQPNSSTITEEFSARAAERARRGLPKSFELPDMTQSGPGPSETLFKLTSVSLDGVHAIPRSELANCYNGFIGRKVSQAHLVELTNAIAEVYKRHGYALTRALVPPQDVENGRVKIQVLEGSIDDVKVEGAGNAWFIPRGLLDGITLERPLRLATLERHMLRVSDLPGVHIADASLKEIGTTTGRFRLTIRAEFRRAIVGLDMDNRGSRDTGPWQSFNTIALSSLIRPGDLLGFNVAGIPDALQELTYAGGVYEIPIGNDGTRIGVRGAYSTAAPAGVGATIATHTQSHDMSLYGSISPVRTREYSLRLTAAVSMREVQETNIWGLYYQDHIRAGAITADIQVRDGMKGANYFSATYRGGIGGWGASDRDFISSRPDAESDFHKSVFTYSRYQGLPGPFSLLVAVTGQATSAAMLKSEAFFVGGSAFGRAFAPGRFLADSGLAGLAELRFDQMVDRPWLKGYQAYVYADAATLWIRGGDIQRVSSYGGGVRYRIDDDLRAGFEVAVPAAIETFGTADHGTRFYVSLSRTFKGCEQVWCF